MWVAVDQEKRRSGLRANLGHRITCTVMAGSDTKGMKCVHPLSPEGRPQSKGRLSVGVQTEHAC